MKKSKFIVLAMSVAILSTSCLGSFTAFNNLKDWNQEITGNKFVNNLIFWGLNIVPVYGLFFVGDALIFNTIEFWSGSNPLAMAEGESETQVIVKNGNTYEMTAQKNQLIVKVIAGEDKGKQVDFKYVAEEQTWNATTQDGETFKLASLKVGQTIVYLPNGEEIEIDNNLSQEEGLAIINSKICNMEGYAVGF